MAGFNFLLDPETGDHVLDEHGRIVLDETARTPMQLALRDELGKWWGDVTQGSAIAETLRGKPPVDAAATLITAVERALAPLKASGRIVSHATVITTNEPLTVRIDAVDGGSRKPISLTFKPLG